MAKPEIPTSSALDSDELAEALETARTKADEMQTEEVRHWLMTAASAARRQGRGDRAGEIARVAAGWSTHESVAPAAANPEFGTDEFHDETIVDQRSRFGLPDEAEALEITVSKDVLVSEKEQKALTAKVRRHATPAVRAKGKVRIALRKDSSDQFAFRVLADGEAPQPEEKEAFLELESGELSIEG